MPNGYIPFDESNDFSSKSFDAQNTFLQKSFDAQNKSATFAHNHHQYGVTGQQMPPSYCYAKAGDLIVDKTYTIEIGGRSKDGKQIANVPRSFIAADDTEYAFGNKIPLWAFGFLY